MVFLIKSLASSPKLIKYVLGGICCFENVCSLFLTSLYTGTVMKRIVQRALLLDLRQLLVRIRQSSVHKTKVILFCFQLQTFFRTTRCLQWTFRGLLLKIN